MSANIATNSWGATNSSLKFANTLIGAVNRDLGCDSDSFEGLEEEGKSKKGGVHVELYDKHLAVLEDYEGFNVTAWMEDNEDICFQFYPPRHMAMFADFELFLEVSDRVSSRILEGVCDATAEFYAHPRGHLTELNPSGEMHGVRLMHTKNTKGVDILQVRLTGMYELPFWEVYLTDIFKAHQDELKKAVAQQSKEW